MIAKPRNLLSAILCWTLLLSAQTSIAQETSALDRAKKRLLAEEHVLRYKYGSGESIRYQVEHLATVVTRIQGTSQTIESRALSTKLWRVLGNKADHIKFEHSIEDAKMWQQVSGRQAEEFDSRSNTEPPEIYKVVADTVGKPISVVTIDTAGKVITREDLIPQFDLGSGGLTMPLPAKPVKIGATWSVPYDMQVKRKNDTYTKIKTRKLYTLEKVQTGIATIAVKTQVLTPANNPHIQSQLVQRLANGEIKFDLKRGRMISKRMDWDESVVGFNGANSSMKYVARFTEKLIEPNAKVAGRPTKSDPR